MADNTGSKPASRRGIYLAGGAVGAAVIAAVVFVDNSPTTPPVTAPPAAQAPSPADLKGAWVGVVEVGSDNVTAVLTVDSVALAEPSGNMAWRAPKTCTMQTEYAGVRDGRFVLNITKTDAPWCDLYWRGTVNVSFQSGSVDNLDFALRNRSQGGTVEGSLERRQP